MESEAALRAALLHLLRTAYPEPAALQAFTVQHWPSFAASWTIDPRARPDGTAPAEPQASEPVERSFSVSEFLREALLRRAEALVDAARSEPGSERGPARAPAPRRLDELIVEEALGSGSVHQLLDAVLKDRPHLIAEVIALREKLTRAHEVKYSAPPTASPSAPLAAPPAGYFQRGQDLPGMGGGLPPPPRSATVMGLPTIKLPTGMEASVSAARPRSVVIDLSARPRHGAAPSPLAQPATLEAQAKGFEPAVELSPAAAAPEALPDGAASDDLAPPDPTAPAPVRPQIVSLGFSNPALPDTPIFEHTLAVDEEYVLWLEIAPEYVDGSLPGAEPLPGLAVGDELDVILFSFPDQLLLDEQRHGRIAIGGERNQVVVPAWTPARGAAREGLYFLVRTPRKPGLHALRCNVYCRGLLLQSHLVTAEVTQRIQSKRSALTRKVDYNLSTRLDTKRLGQASACEFSLFLNDDGNGTHSFRFVSSTAGMPEQIADGHIDGGQLANLVSHAREALRFFAWGTSEPWTKDDHYLLDHPDPVHLELAWTRMARRGANLWMKLTEVFGALGPEARKLRDKLRSPGVLQLALKESPDSIFPAALIYDYPFDIGLSQVTLCQAAFEAIRLGRPLHQEPCFLGQCPSYESRSVVCPGGFWGFRHELGLPVHLPKGEVAVSIPRGQAVRAFAAVSMDKAFEQREDHLRELEKLLPGGLKILRDRQSCLSQLGEPRQLVYFYCHGGLMPDTETPYLLVGPNNSDRLFAQSLFDAGVFWPDELRPLVIVNGCHTTATSPDEMFSMLSAFAAHGNAAGVIGTEITNFEPVAVAFGEALLRRFLAGEPLGRAVKLARLSLLATGNPLGLMYIPFALPSLHLA